MGSEAERRENVLIVIGANNVAVLGAVVVVDGESYLPLSCSI